MDTIEGKIRGGEARRSTGGKIHVVESERFSGCLLRYIIGLERFYLGCGKICTEDTSVLLLDLFCRVDRVKW